MALLLLASIWALEMPLNVYSYFVERYSKSPTAQRSASEIEQDISTFHLDDSFDDT
jgi:hypothetical protein